MLSTLREEIQRARELGVAIGAFNVYNMELARGVIAAAERTGAPVFLQSNFSNLQNAGAGSFIAYVKALAGEAEVPVAVHLDHGQSFEEASWALVQGFTSVMFDGSSLPFEENVAMTREVVRLARSVGATVEGELGAVGGDEDQALSHLGKEEVLPFTDPDQAEEFVKATDVDILAVSVGNVHGHYRGEPKLRFDLLEEIHQRTGAALALHGASGLSAEDLQRAARCGVVKVNFNTDLRQAYVEGMNRWWGNDEGQLNFLQLRKALIEPVAQVVEERLTWMGSAQLWRIGG